MRRAAAGVAFAPPGTLAPPPRLVIGMITAPGAGWFWRSRSPRQGAARVHVRSMIAWLRRTSAAGGSKVSGGPDLTPLPPGWGAAPPPPAPQSTVVLPVV